MPLELTSNNIAAVMRYGGSGSFEVSGGKHLKVETIPDGEEILDFELPAGNWEVGVHITVTKL